ncbi:MAG: ATP-NAD kinase family protein [Dehalococcoidia bacterium]|nr:ATP-NAD kinase family protein [Dehalococcoidia bacterium]
MKSIRLGFLVNPIAGMGGRVGLKGTDHMLKNATALHAKPIAPGRALEFLMRLKELTLTRKVELITCPGLMGENEIRKVGLKATILSMPRKKETAAEDTKLAIRLMAKSAVELTVFVGGDGTAKDILDAMGKKVSLLVLGVPSGVKMYSGVFAASPRDAADVVGDFLDGSAQIIDFEVMDADEEAIRCDRLNVRLHGLLKGPFTPMRLLGSKHLSPETENEHESQVAVARFVAEEVKPDATYILGPGTTIKCIADLLGVEKTILGVDIYRDGKVVKDVNEKGILREVKDWNSTWIVLSPIGRQGMLLGRGNQQISPEIIRQVGKDRIIVVATRSKIQGTKGGVLRVDTGDQEVDKMLRGYIKTATDYREWRLLEIV